MSEHTPGPWIFAPDFDENGKRPCITTVAVCANYRIGLDSTPYPGGNYRDGDPSGDPEADARLIAAAPDLLEALTSLVAATEGVSVGNYNEEAHDIAVSKARAAIAKATGVEE